MKNQKAYSEHHGFKKYWELLDKPPRQIRKYLTAKTRSGRINQAVKIAVEDFLEVKDENFRLKNENEILRKKIEQIKINELKINELNNENKELLNSNY